MNVDLIKEFKVDNEYIGHLHKIAIELAGIGHILKHRKDYLKAVSCYQEAYIYECKVFVGTIVAGIGDPSESVLLKSKNALIEDIKECIKLNKGV